MNNYNLSLNIHVEARVALGASGRGCGGRSSRNAAPLERWACVRKEVNIHKFKYFPVTIHETYQIYPRRLVTVSVGSIQDILKTTATSKACEQKWIGNILQLVVRGRFEIAEA